jgi:hypothetical protein
MGDWHGGAEIKICITTILLKDALFDGRVKFNHLLKNVSFKPLDNIFILSSPAFER